MEVRLLRWAAAVIAVLPATAQPLGGPLTGYVFDPPTASVRAIVGRPGSARLGPAVVANVEFASVPGGAAHALFVRGGRLLFVANLAAETREEADLAEMPELPDSVAWSGNHSTAVIVWRGCGCIQTLRGIPGSPVLSERVSVSAPGTLSAVAADSSGENIAVLLDGSNREISLFDANLVARPLPRLDSPVAITFGGSPERLWASLAGENRLVEVDIDGLAVGSVIPIEEQASALGFTGEGHTLAALLGSRRLLLFDSATRNETGSAHLDSDAYGLARMAPGVLAVMGQRDSGQPLWVLHRGEIAFIPAPPLPAEESPAP